MSAEFCDSNILVYAHDTTAASKHRTSRELVERLWREECGALSVQVLQELFVTLTRKVSQPIDANAAREVVADLSNWQVVAPGAAEVIEAIDASTRWQLSFWDAMIVVTAQRVGAQVLWSEDLSDGQRFDSVTVRNPFRYR